MLLLCMFGVVSSLYFASIGHSNVLLVFPVFFKIGFDVSVLVSIRRVFSTVLNGMYFISLVMLTGSRCLYLRRKVNQIANANSTTGLCGSTKNTQSPTSGCMYQF